ncbi:hypothetical protein ACFWSF_09235 [Streptomyces sp. NPDC058611]|uniref:hypothetical protein n=1 Tax=unclassified Streptomyces TaxID=2593676 RepID=UPI0036653EC4
MITCHAVERPGTGIHVRRDEDGRIVGACGEGDGEDQDGANAATRERPVCGESLVCMGSAAGSLSLSPASERG